MSRPGMRRVQLLIESRAAFIAKFLDRMGAPISWDPANDPTALWTTADSFMISCVGPGTIERWEGEPAIHSEGQEN